MFSSNWRDLMRGFGPTDRISGGNGGDRMYGSLGSEGEALWVTCSAVSAPEPA
jgi:hypothetical protein